MEAEMKAKASEKMGSEQTEPWHKPKKGSVFPAKRRSVKQMMWDRVVDLMASKVSKSKKNNSIHPF